MYIGATFSVLNEDMYEHTYIVLAWVWGGNLFDGNEVGYIWV
jgi:hypothetical protein